MLIYILNAMSMPVYGRFIKNKKVMSFVASAQMFLILAFRSITLGVDMKTYLGAFGYISDMSFKELFVSLHLLKNAELTTEYILESGYVLLNWITAKAGLDFRGFIVIVAFLTIAGIGYFIGRYSKIPWMSFFLFATLGMYNYCFGILRQSLAIAMLLAAVPLLEKKKWVPFAFVVFAAFEIHRVSIMFILLVPFVLFDIYPSKEIFKKAFKYFGWIIALSPLIYKTVIVTGLKLLGKKSYLKVNFQWNWLIVLMMLILVAVWIFSDFSIFRGRFERMMFWGYVLGIFVEAIGMSNDVLARAVEVFYIFVIVLIPHVLYNLPEETVIDLPWDISVELNGKVLRKIADVCIVIGLTAFLVTSLNGAKLYPYRSVFTDTVFTEISGFFI